MIMILKMLNIIISVIMTVSSIDKIGAVKN